MQQKIQKLHPLHGSTLFLHIFILIIFLMLLTALLNYISIILVKYHIFLHDFFGLAEMYITRGFSRLRWLKSETKIPFTFF